MLLRVSISKSEIGLLFKEREFVRILPAGNHLIANMFRRLKVVNVSLRDIFFAHPDADILWKSGALNGLAEACEVKDDERAIVWKAGRFHSIIGPGRYILWTVLDPVRVEIVKIAEPRFVHAELRTILQTPSPYLDSFVTEDHQLALLFRNGRFVEVLGAGKHAFWRTSEPVRVENVSLREPLFTHKDAEFVWASGAIAGRAELHEVKDNKRALVWKAGRFHATLGPGRYIVWTVLDAIRFEIVAITEARITHSDLATIARSATSASHLDSYVIEEFQVGLLFRDGRFTETLAPGQHAFWRAAGRNTVKIIDLRESQLEIGGQEIMTADRVTLRLNATVTIRVKDPLASATKSVDPSGALYKDVQLALRAIVGTRELDELLAEKDVVAAALRDHVAPKAATLGLEVISVGIRDIILPGEMKELLNRVTEARKGAEAALISRREETASMRHQLNTAKLIESNPTLLKLREIEALERVAAKTSLTVVLGDGSLADRVTKLI